MSQSILPINVPTLSYVGQISRTRSNNCFYHFDFASCGTWSPPFAAVGLNCCVLATWSYGSGVTADRGRGALSQQLKPSGGLQTEADLNLR